jgi:hypothetical protein
MRSIAFTSCLALAALSACESKKAYDDYMSKGKVSEAELNLKRIEKGLKAYHVEKAAFPSGSVPLTPSTPCCEGPKHKCEVNLANWGDDPTWKALDFMVDEPAFFQYGYESNGTKATITAVGDLDCDATTVSYTLVCEAKDGAPVCTLTAPANKD